MNETTFTSTAHSAADALWPSLHSAQWLWLLPVVLIVFALLLLLARKGRERALAVFAAPRLLGSLLGSLSHTRRLFKTVLVLAGAALIVLALARPQYGYRWSESRSRGIDVMFVLDTSRSMLATDIKPDRLQRAKLAILDFVDQLDGDRIGLVAFAGDAFVQCPLTLDYNVFEQSLEAIDTDTIPVGGTDFSKAITIAEDAFAKDNNHKILIMLTDGEDLEGFGLKRAKEAAKNGVTIFTVGVGTEEGSLIPISDRFGRRDFLRDESGQQVITRLESDTLNDIAEVTGGFYVPLGSAGQGLQTVYHAGLQSFEKQELSSQMKREGIDRFQWPLGIALILLAWEPLTSNRRTSARRALGLFRRRRKDAKKTTAAQPRIGQSGATSAIAALLVPALFATAALLPLPAKAANPRDAESLFNKGDYAAAQEAFAQLLQTEPENVRARYNLANTQLAQKQYEQAAKTYAQVLASADIPLQADTFYNLGLAHYGRGAQAFEGSDPAQTQAQSVQAREASTQAIQAGRQLLQQAAQIATLEQQRSASLPLDAPHAQQKPEIPQEAVQQAIQFAEQAKQASESAEEAGEAFIEKAQVASGFWRRSEADFNSAAELSTNNFADARHNAEQMQKSIDALSARINQTQNANRAHATDAQSLEKLIEELKKLLKEPPPNEQQQDQNQQQDQQQQDQQDSQQDQQDSQQNQQDSQGGENKQQQQGGQDSQSDQQQQDGQQQNDQQDQQQQGDQQDQQQDQGENQQQPAEGDQQQQQDSQQQQDGQQQDQQQQDGQQGDNKDDRKEQESEGQNSEGQQNEQPQNQQGEQQGQQQPERSASEPSGQQGEQQRGANPEEQGVSTPGEEQAIDLSDEQKEQLAAGEQPAQDQPLANQQEGGTARAGAMSQQEAAGLLDSLNNSGKLLPLSGRGQHQPTNRPRKNW